MFKTRFISILALLCLTVSGAWADTTVTWEGTKLQSIAVCKGYGFNVTTESMTVDGITITANEGYFLNGEEGVMLLSGAANGVVFSAENNIKSITITSTDYSKFTPDGDVQFSGGSHTYEVSPAATSYGFANSVSIDGITKIEITLEGAPAASTYTVSLKEGTEDATSWTITPAEATTTGVAAGTEVKATYGGAKKVKSIKAVKKAPAGPPSWKLTLSSPAKDLYITANGGLIAQHTLDVASTEFTVEMPELTSQTVNIVATDGSGNCWYCTQENMSFAIGQTYQSSPTMTALGTESSADVYKMTEAGTIPDGKTVVLSDVTISGASITCSGNATIILMGTNTVTANGGNAAIKIGDSGTTLTITGSGSLTATGSNGGAGIGTDRVMPGGTLSGGNIVINGGTVIAQGGAQGGAGIGTGLSMGTNTCGAITIGTGVISVTAKKSSDNPGPNSIGKGRISANGTQACGTITIGGTIYWDGSAYQNDGETYLGSDITYPTAP